MANSCQTGSGERPLRERDIQGLKYLQSLAPLLERLRPVGTARDRAGNRQLFMDQYCALILLFLFNPVVRSLRSLQQASQLRNVQSKLKVSRASLGSLSEATEVFDPALLREIVGELAAQVRPLRKVGQDTLAARLVAVDGTVIKTLATIAEAAYLKDKNGRSQSAWRLHTHFDIDCHVPTQIEVTSARNGGATSEKQVLRRQLEPDHCYVKDRGYAEFKLFNEIHDIGSSYVCRLQDKSNLDDVVEERELSDAAREAQVLRDVVVQLGASNKKNRPRPTHPVRVILVQTTPHVKRGGRKGGTAGPPSDGILRIATNLLDVPAEVIAAIYHHRWLIEIFFRFFKHILGCRHLLSQDPVGIEIQAYCAIIACLLISLWTGRKPTLRTYEMICLYLQGWAEEDELLSHLEKLKPHAP
jgi:hypothetical protein